MSVLKRIGCKNSRIVNARVMKQKPSIHILWTSHVWRPKYIVTNSCLDSSLQCPQNVDYALLQNFGTLRMGITGGLIFCISGLLSQ